MGEGFEATTNNQTFAVPTGLGKFFQEVDQSSGILDVSRAGIVDDDKPAVFPCFKVSFFGLVGKGILQFPSVQRRPFEQGCRYAQIQRPLNIGVGEMGKGPGVENQS